MPVNSRSGYRNSSGRYSTVPYFSVNRVHRDSDSIPSPPLPNCHLTHFHTLLPNTSSSQVDSRFAGISRSPAATVGLKPHPMGRGLAPGKHKASTLDLRSERTVSGWFADGDYLVALPDRKHFLALVDICYLIIVGAGCQFIHTRLLD